jgi:diguanylate cyclase (GGDEF)-like protein
LGLPCRAELTFRSLFCKNNNFLGSPDYYDGTHLARDLRRLLEGKTPAFHFETPLQEGKKEFFFSVYVRYDQESALLFVMLHRLKRMETYLASFFDAVKKDQATGLFNKAMCLAAIRDIKLTDQVCVVFCDINNFKLINDVYGHIAGDKVIKDFAEAFLTDRPSGVRVYRFGGDEFVVIAEGLSRAAMAKYLAEAKSRVESHTPANMNLSFSAGAVSASPYMKDPLFLIRCSDMAMYMAKKKKIPFYFLTVPEMRRIIDDESIGTTF